MQAKAVIFDCDGVLVDSEGISARILISCLASAGIDVSVSFVLRNYVGRSFSTVREMVETRFDTRLPKGFEHAYRSDLLETFATELLPTAGLKDVLSALKVPICVATSSSPIRVAKSLDLTGLSGFFGTQVFSASQVENGKPAPDLFLFAAQQIGIDPVDCVVIEDSLPGIAAARAANMDVLRYEGGAHLIHEPTAEQPHPPVRRFRDWADLPDLMPGLFSDAA